MTIPSGRSDWRYAKFSALAGMTWRAPAPIDGGDLDQVAFHIRPIAPRIHPHSAPDATGNGAQKRSGHGPPSAALRATCASSAAAPAVICSAMSMPLKPRPSRITTARMPPSRTMRFEPTTHREDGDVLAQAGAGNRPDHLHPLAETANPQAHPRAAMSGCRGGGFRGQLAPYGDLVGLHGLGVAQVAGGVQICGAVAFWWGRRDGEYLGQDEGG